MLRCWGLAVERRRACKTAMDRRERRDGRSSSTPTAGLARFEGSWSNPTNPPPSLQNSGDVWLLSSTPESSSQVRSALCSQRPCTTFASAAIQHTTATSTASRLEQQRFTHLKGAARPPSAEEYWLGRLGCILDWWMFSEQSRPCQLPPANVALCRQLVDVCLHMNKGADSSRMWIC